MTTQQPVILVDGSSYLYRAYHALPLLETSTGQPTGAVRGVISMLRRLLIDYSGSPIAVIFDAKGPTFRHLEYPEYKAHRPPMPDDLRAQIEPIHELVRCLGLTLISEPGVEADDVIGTLANQAISGGREVVISTGDKDMAQLVNQHVTLVNTMTDTVMDIEGVKQKFGVPPELIIDYLALLGDKVDNIPGVPGVGEKTALALLQNIGGITEIYNNLEKIPALGFRGAKAMAQKLQENRENALLSYRLATIRLDVPLHVSLNDIHPSVPDRNKLLEQYKLLEFKSWIEEIEQELDLIAGKIVAKKSTIEKDYQCILDITELETWVKKIAAANLFSFDTETTSLDYINARVVGVSFAVNEGEAAYVPFGHNYIGVQQQLTESQVLGTLKSILEDPSKAKVGQNLKYDKSVLANHGIQLRGIQYDTMLESYVLNSIANRHDMDTLSLIHLNIEPIHFEDIAGKGTKQLTFDQIKLEEAAPYAAEDADITLRLHNKLYAELSRESSLLSVFHDIEMPLLPVLSKIERNGALVDAELLTKQSKLLGQRMLELENEAFDLAGEKFNLNSPKQLQSIFFEKLGLPIIKKTPKGQPSTAEPILQELALDYPLPKVILEYRSLSKLKSTYTDKLPLQINPLTGRVHTSYHQAVAATGRLSSVDPNLQNIPIRTTEGRCIRQAFIAPAGYKILAADYSQIELRIMAHLSQDKNLLRAFAENLDVHRATAGEVFGVGIENVTDEMRRRAKAINFGLIYGMSAFGLARQLNLGRNEAQQYIDLYFERYPGVMAYMENIRETARAKGYVETIFGRRLYLPEINSSKVMLRQAAERTAINAPMQGSAADIIKRAMIAVDAWLERDIKNTKVIMQVHDELVLEVIESEVNEVSRMLPLLMAGAAELDVPLVVDVGVGDNWDEAH